MALRDTWHKTLVYFGLAEPDNGYRDDEPEPPEPERELEDSYRDRPNVRRLQSRRRRDEIDDIFADDSPAERRTRPLRSVEPAAGTNGGRRSVRAPRAGIAAALQRAQARAAPPA